MKSSRRRSRELAIQALYQWQLAHDSAETLEKQLRDSPGFAKCDEGHFVSLLHGVIEHEPELEREFAALLDRPTAQLSPVEHAIILLGAFELRHHPEIPYKVVVNEAVELAKSFGGTDGFKYVNGVLDKLAAKVRASEVRARA